MRAMILAAGLGTRLKPLTNSIPKALIKISEHTLLELQIKRIKLAGFSKIIINIHHHAGLIEEYLRENLNFGCDIELSDESAQLLETGGGLKKASWFFSDSLPFLVNNVDIISDINLSELLDHHRKSNALATLAVMERKSSRYFLYDEENFLVGWKNEQTGNSKIVREPTGDIKPFAFSGIQILNPAIFEYFPSKDFFSLVDFYLAVAVEEKINLFNHSSGRFYDLGKKENLDKAYQLYEEVKNIYQA